MQAATFVRELLSRKFDFFTGVPCSFIKPLINYVIDSPECHYVPATIEGEAIAIAAGARMAGHNPVVMLQNSGLGNIVNPVTSLLSVYRIPALIIVTWRAAPNLKDAAQHTIMGQITPDLLRLLGIPYEILKDDDASLTEMLDRAAAHMQNERSPFAIIVQKDTVEPYALRSKRDYVRRNNFGAAEAPTSRAFPDRDSAMQVLAPAFKGVPVVATTGFTSRALYNSGDQPWYFYMQGSMGFAASIALGASLFRKGPVAVIDGDGSLLMRMSVLATLGAFHRSNLTYVLLDNNAHDSTGGQVTISANVRFDRLAEATGFDHFAEAGELSTFGELVNQAVKRPDLSFVYLKTQPGAGNEMDRPSLTPPQIADRFSSFLQEGSRT